MKRLRPDLPPSGLHPSTQQQGSTCQQVCGRPNQHPARLQRMLKLIPAASSVGLRLAALMLLLVLLPAAPVFAVPLADWQPDEDKLLGREPVTRADLPDEWQAFSDEQLRAKAKELQDQSASPQSSDEYSAALRANQLYFYIAAVVGSLQDQAKALNSIGAVWKKFSSYQQALTHFQQALVLAQAANDPDSQRYALGSIGVEYLALARYEEALDYLNQSLSIARTLKDWRGESRALVQIGLAYEKLSRYEQALLTLNQALDMAQKNRDLPFEASTLNCIAIAQSEAGNNELALNYFQQALALAREVGFQEEELRLLMNLGNLYLILGEYSRGLDYIEQARALELKLWGSNQDNTIIMLSAEAYIGLGDYQKALGYLEIAAKNTRDMEARAEYLSVLDLTGDLYRAQGDYESARSNYEQALQLARDIKSRSSETNALSNMGSLHCDAGDYKLAEDAFTKAFEIASDLAVQFTWESGMKGGVTEELGKAGSRLAQVQLALGKPAEAFATTQSAKGVPLLQLMAQAELQTDDPAEQQALNAYRAANAERQVYEQQLNAIAESDPDAATKRAEAQQQIDQYQAQADDAWDYLKQHDPQLTQIIGVNGLTAEEVQQQVLKPGQVVLEYLYVDPDEQLPAPAACRAAEPGSSAAPAAAGAKPEATGELIVFCVPWEGELSVARTALPDLREHGGSLSAWLAQQLSWLYSAGTAGEVPARRAEAQRALYELLLAPIAQALPASGPDGQPIELVICPDRQLYAIPYEALLDADGQLVLDKYLVSYSTSATTLSYIRAGESANQALVAGATFGAEAGLSATDQQALVRQLEQYRSRDVTRGGVTGASSFCPLPGVAEETREVAQVLGTAALLDDQATEAELRLRMPGCEVIHLATHGFLSDIPLLNGVAVAVTKQMLIVQESDRLVKDTANDGFLTMSEVMGIPLHGCQLVTVSACHSAEGAGAAGGGVMGLTQGFLYAGAQGVLASLTKVDDDATRQLMVAFYRHWRTEGMSKAAALRQAKLDLAAAGSTAAPSYWAPFVLYGRE